MATTGATAAQSCTVCDNDNNNLHRCAKCKSAYYCSKGCQEADWRTHKLLCADFANFDLSTRPTEDHVRAVHFPDNEQKPKVIWVHAQWWDVDVDEDEDEDGYQFPELQPFLGSVKPGLMPLKYNPTSGRVLPTEVRISYRENFFGDGSKPNMSVAAIAATKPGSHFNWRGPILAWGVGTEGKTCKDIEMVDYRQVVLQLLSYKYKPLPPTQEVNIKGVRINCLGDELLLKKPRFEAIEVPTYDPLFTQNSTSDIAARIGIPIFTRRCSPDPKWAKNQENELFRPKGPFYNPNATYLHLSCDPRPEPDILGGDMGFGMEPLQWHDNAGSVDIIRQDGKPLLPIHLEALCKYCRYQIRPLMSHHHGEYHPEEPMTPPTVLSMISQRTFQMCWYEMLAVKREAGDMVHVPNPYDM